MAQELEEYLTMNNFQMEMKHALGPNSLRSPTQKDFTYIFQWLYKRIDPAYVFQQKGMDTEVPPILKQLRYPFEKSITKSQLTAVGGNNWYTFLGMLHWMMQVAEMMKRYENGRYDDACAENGVDVSGDRIAFRFLSNAYQTWLSSPPGDDDDPEEADKILIPHVRAMAAEFEQVNRQYADELKVLEAGNAALKAELEEVEKNTPNVAKLNEHFEILQGDVEKFIEYKVNIEAKEKKWSIRNEALKKDIEHCDAELSEANKEKTELQQAVDQQGITIQDIDQMNGERERLQKGVEAARIRLDEVTLKIKDKEAEASGKLIDLEALARQYNALCYDVGMRGEDYELNLNINDAPFSSSQLGVSQHGASGRLLADNETGYHPSRILNLDLRGKVKRDLTGLRREIGKRRDAAKDQHEENRQMLFEVSGAIDEKRQEVEALEHRVRSAGEEFEKTKEVCEMYTSGMES
jgi:kinetochore protein NDC80